MNVREAIIAGELNFTYTDRCGRACERELGKFTFVEHGGEVEPVSMETVLECDGDCEVTLNPLNPRYITMMEERAEKAEARVAELEQLFAAKEEHGLALQEKVSRYSNLYIEARNAAQASEDLRQAIEYTLRVRETLKQCELQERNCREENDRHLASLERAEEEFFG